MRTKIFYSFLLFSILFCPVTSCAQEHVSPDSLVWRHLVPGPHPVGYRVLHLYDRTRTMAPQPGSTHEQGTDANSRPLQISIWYPAVSAEDSRQVERIDYFIATLTQYDFKAWEGASRAEKIAEMRRRSGSMLSNEQFTTLAHEPMHARLDVTPAVGPFPLIVYGTGGGSEPWENSLLFEYLASYGYVVATCPSFGTYSYEMEDNDRGIETKVRDMEFILARMMAEPYVDARTIGVAGWSWGGLGSILLAMRNARVDAVASLDGSIAYPGGRNAVRDNPFFDWRRFRSPLLHVSQRGGMPDFTFLEKARYSERALVHTARMNHVDFAWSQCVRAAMLRNDMGNLERKAEDYAAVASVVRAFFDRHLRRVDAKLDIPSQTANIQYFPAVSAPPLPEDFMSILQRDGSEHAESTFRSARQADPQARLFEEAELIELAQQYAGRGKTQDALRLLNMVTETYPRSWLAHAQAAALYQKSGDNEAATEHAAKCEEIAAAIEKARLERASHTAPPREEMAGSYGEGMQGVIIALSDGELVAAGEPVLKLLPVSDTEFNIEQRPGISIRFVFDEENHCAGLLLKMPNGALALAKKQ